MLRPESRAAGAGGGVEPWPLHETREELGDYADALTQRLPGEKVRRAVGWAPPLRPPSSRS